MRISDWSSDVCSSDLAATQEIANNVQQAASGTQQVTNNISGVTQAASETGGAVAQMQSSSGELAHQAEHPTVEVDKFLQVVRTAWPNRSEELRVGEDGCSTCRYRWWP